MLHQRRWSTLNTMVPKHVFTGYLLLTIVLSCERKIRVRDHGKRKSLLVVGSDSENVCSFVSRASDSFCDIQILYYICKQILLTLIVTNTDALIFENFPLNPIIIIIIYIHSNKIFHVSFFFLLLFIHFFFFIFLSNYSALVFLKKKKNSILRFTVVV